MIVFYIGEHDAAIQWPGGMTLDTETVERVKKILRQIQQERMR